MGDSRSSTTGAAPVAAGGRRASVWLTWAALVVLGAALGAGALVWVGSSTRPVPEGEVRFPLNAPAKQRFQASLFAPSPAVATNGRHVAVLVQGEDGIVRLAVRTFDRLDVKILTGTEGAELPFWSPDSGSIGFFAQGKLKVIDITSGLVRTVCDAAAGGGTWSADATILFGGGAILRVPAAGGTPRPVTTLDLARKDSAHRHPFFLPDGRHFFFVAGVPVKAWLGARDSADRRPLEGAESKVEFARGSLVYQRQGALVAQPFDSDTLAVTGDAEQVAESVGSNRGTGNAAFSVSGAGVLVYRSGSTPAIKLAWADVAGKALGTTGELSNYQGVDLSPDGRNVVVHRHIGAGGDIWILDSQRGTASNLTLDAAVHHVSPCWVGEQHVAYAKAVSGGTEFWWRPAGGGAEEKLHAISLPGSHLLTDCRGPAILFSQTERDTGLDIWALPVQGDRTPRKLLGDKFNETQGQLSPDGRWLAYQSDETGRFEVYVQSYPPRGEGKVPVSATGGAYPRWRPDGRALFYLSLDGKLSRGDVAVVGGALRVERSVTLFDMDSNLNNGLLSPAPYAVTRDGRFLVATRAADTVQEPLTVVMNWRPPQVK